MKSGFLFALALAPVMISAQTNTFPSSGNVGIGTTGPMWKLEVNGPTAIGGGNLDPNQGGNITPLLNSAKLLIGWNRSGGSGETDFIANRGAGVMGGFNFYDFSNSGVLANLMTIQGTGNVGIGTVTPSAKLDVSVSSPFGQLGSAVNLALRNTDTAAFNATQIASYDASGNLTAGLSFRNLASGIAGSSDVTFSVRNVGSILAALYLGSNGNVGVGTTNPTYPLSVNGTVRAKEVIVDTGWSDYVFADNYKLAPLSEVERHIKAEKHLPGLPSAQEVAEHGVSMGEMQAKLLAKIEEMTLHQIEQEKEIKALQAEVAKSQNK